MSGGPPAGSLRGRIFLGVFDGFVTQQLADEWLRLLNPDALAQVEIFACGPTAMLEATVKVARAQWGAVSGFAGRVYGLLLWVGARGALLPCRRRMGRL